ncbi:hypothetical protein Acr_06g0012720 [Actinidia rufa]|uniref:Uncharacterized protein n=1 Tax=Actinidia rufa TaxID=165716 RepID=A0A7J0ESK9_9ERIC|nr:hypothetical protein Acr_06g0012720 [Actinidia rufa]
MCGEEEVVLMLVGGDMLTLGRLAGTRNHKGQYTYDNCFLLHRVGERLPLVPPEYEWQRSPSWPWSLSQYPQEVLEKHS